MLLVGCFRVLISLELTSQEVPHSNFHGEIRYLFAARGLAATLQLAVCYETIHR